MNKININLLDVSELPIPISLSDLFGNDRKVSVEIGSGDGDFLIETAIMNPERNYIGIEIKTRRSKIAAKTAGKLKVGNLLFLHMDAIIALQELFPHNSISEAYINFPDPWPKDRHRKHRIINRAFLKTLSDVIKKDGHLEIASDHSEYIQSAIDTFLNIEFFKNIYDEPWYLHNIPERPMTKYERKFRGEGREIYYMKFTNIK